MAKAFQAEGFKAGWYGKLPASGDFVHRGLSRPQIQWWDRWLQRGVADLSRTSRDGETVYLRAPFWNFVLPAGLGTGVVQLGCIGPSRDRVGRCFPLALVMSIDALQYKPELLAGSAAFYRCLGASMLGALRHGRHAAQLDDSLRLAEQSMDALLVPAADLPSSGGGDDILSVLNGGHDIAPLTAPRNELGWADLPLYFNEGSVTSYWWTSSAEGAAHQSHIHGGMLNSTLFDRLFLGHAGRR